jgi:putative transposase
VVAGERDRPDVARRRAQWIKYQGRIDPSRLVFIDETWTKTNMAPLRGWAPCGSRLIAKVPHRHWQTTTLLAALRHDGIDAPWLLEGPIDGESFQTYSRRSCSRPCGPATSSLWTISAATRARSSAN